MTDKTEQKKSGRPKSLVDFPSIAMLFDCVKLVGNKHYGSTRTFLAKVHIQESQELLARYRQHGRASQRVIDNCLDYIEKNEGTRDFLSVLNNYE